MLNVQVKSLGSLVVLCLRGRVVRGELAPLRAAVTSHSGATAVVLDLTGVTSIDAGGLGAMLEMREQARAKGIEFKLMNVSRHAGWVLEVTRLNSVFDVASSAEAYFGARGQYEPTMFAACA